MKTSPCNRGLKANLLSWQKLLATIFFEKESAMVLAPNFCCKNCLRVVSAMRGNPPLGPVTISLCFHLLFTRKR